MLDQLSIQYILIYANGGCYFAQTRNVTRSASITFHLLKAVRYIQEEEARTNKTWKGWNLIQIGITDITKQLSIIFLIYILELW